MNRDNYAQMRELAQAEASKANMPIALVLSPIDNAEEPGDWGYCPESAITLLFRFCERVEIVNP